MWSPSEKDMLNKDNDKNVKHCIDFFDKIEEDTEILITHEPPFTILDGKFGNIPLLEKIKTLKKLKLHCFGHIHNQRGHLYDEKLKITCKNFFKFVKIIVINSAVHFNKEQPFYLDWNLEKNIDKD
jgi:hypothetical protein